MNTVSFLKDKKVLLVGLGLHGGGASVLAYLLKHGARVRVTDLKTRKELHTSLKIFKKIPGTFGKEDVRDVSWSDIIVKNPGVPKDNTLIRHARKQRKIIVTDITLFQLALNKKFDCVVTGTRGKTTTTSLIGHICKGYLKKVFVGGNNRVPVLSSSKFASQGSVILELSSFQIEDSHPKARVAVFTNFSPDHLNRYPSLISYFRAKADLFLHQEHSDVAVLNYDNTIIRKLSEQICSKVLFFSTHKLPISVNGVYIHGNKFFIQNNKASRFVIALSKIKLFGEHNYQNYAAAICAAHAMQIPLRVIKKQLVSFNGVEYRLQCVRIFKQRYFFNDTTATSPEALVAAYRSLRDRFPNATIHFIVGGADKKLDFSILKKISRDPKMCLYPLKGTATKKLLQSMNRTKSLVFTSFSEAFTLAWEKSVPGDLIVLSPGAASFGMFLHEFDRGQQFNSLVKKLR